MKTAMMVTPSKRHAPTVKPNVKSAVPTAPPVTGIPPIAVTGLLTPATGKCATGELRTTVLVSTAKSLVRFAPPTAQEPSKRLVSTVVMAWLPVMRSATTGMIAMKTRASRAAKSQPVVMVSFGLGWRPAMMAIPTTQMRALQIALKLRVAMVLSSLALRNVMIPTLMRPITAPRSVVFLLVAMALFKPAKSAMMGT